MKRAISILLLCVAVIGCQGGYYNPPVTRDGDIPIRMYLRMYPDSKQCSIVARFPNGAVLLYPEPQGWACRDLAGLVDR